MKAENLGQVPLSVHQKYGSTYQIYQDGYRRPKIEIKAVASGAEPRKELNECLVINLCSETSRQRDNITIRKTAEPSFNPITDEADNPFSDFEFELVTYALAGHQELYDYELLPLPRISKETEKMLGEEDKVRVRQVVDSSHISWKASPQELTLQKNDDQLITISTDEEGELIYVDPLLRPRRKNDKHQSVDTSGEWMESVLFPYRIDLTAKPCLIELIAGQVKLPGEFKNGAPQDFDVITGVNFIPDFIDGLNPLVYEYLKTGKIDKRQLRMIVDHYVRLEETRDRKPKEA
ncbi:hypothetical protein M1307_00695 [Patescibacteria group bacterium]|nr:hypothetical protein [Patescibacteria group bacterium]